jgi:hypothetical protein
MVTDQACSLLDGVASSGPSGGHCCTLLHHDGAIHHAIHHALSTMFQPEFRFIIFSLPCFQVARPQLSEEERKKKVKELQVI